MSSFDHDGTIDHPPPGWFSLCVMRTRQRSWNWCSLMIDVPPREAQAGARSRSVFVRIPGKHRNKAAAEAAWEATLATKH